MKHTIALAAVALSLDAAIALPAVLEARVSLDNFP